MSWYERDSTDPVAVAIRKIAAAPSDASVSIDSRDASNCDTCGSWIEHDVWVSGKDFHWRRVYDDLGELLREILTHS